MAAKISAPELNRRSRLGACRLLEVAVGDSDRGGQRVRLVPDDNGPIRGVRAARHQRNRAKRARQKCSAKDHCFSPSIVRREGRGEDRRRGEALDGAIAEDRGAMHHPGLRQVIERCVVRGGPLSQKATSPSFQRQRTVNSGLARCAKRKASSASLSFSARSRMREVKPELTKSPRDRPRSCARQDARLADWRRPPSPISPLARQHPNACAEIRSRNCARSSVRRGGSGSAPTGPGKPRHSIPKGVAAARRQAARRQMAPKGGVSMKVTSVCQLSLSGRSSGRVSIDVISGTPSTWG